MVDALSLGEIGTLPHPVARPLRAAQVAESAAKRYQHLSYAGEALLQLAGTLALLDAAAEGDPLKRLGDRPLRASPGFWRDCLDALTHKRRAPTVDALRALRRDKARWAEVREVIGALVQARNAHAHPIRVPSEAEARERTPDLVAALRRALALFDWLSHLVLLRIGGPDPVSGQIRVTPLVGPEALPTPCLVRWTRPPATDQVVAVDLTTGRYVVLAPLYRWQDEQLQAHLRTEDGRAFWYAVAAPDRAPSTLPVDDDRWLNRRLRAGTVERGQLADVAALQNRSDTTRLPLAPPARPTAPKRRRGLVWFAVALCLGGAAFGAWTWVERVDRGPAPPGQLIPIDQPPTRVFEAMARAYNAGDADALHRHYLDRLECYYNHVEHPTAKRLKGTRKSIEGKPDGYRLVEALERGRRGTAALVEERFEHPNVESSPPPALSRYYKLVQRAGHWRIAAESGSHRDGTPCACRRQLHREFGLPPPLRAAQTRR